MFEEIRPNFTTSTSVPQHLWSFTKSLNISRDIFVKFHELDIFVKFHKLDVFVKFHEHYVFVKFPELDVCEISRTLHFCKISRTRHVREISQSTLDHCNCWLSRNMWNNSTPCKQRQVHVPYIHVWKRNHIILTSAQLTILLFQLDNSFSRQFHCPGELDTTQHSIPWNLFLPLMPWPTTTYHTHFPAPAITSSKPCYL